MTPVAATRKTASRSVTLSELFDGRKAKWLPLYRRLLARSTELSKVESVIQKNSIRLGEMGQIRVLVSGLELVLKMRSRKKTIRLSQLGHIDAELLAWIKTAFVMSR